MDLLPQSRHALDEYVASSGDDFEHELRTIESWATRTVPDCVAMSVTLLEDDLTFTMVSPDSVEEVDARSDPSHERPPSRWTARWAVLDEQGWAELAQDDRAPGIASTLSLPVIDRGRVVLTIDLYASTPHAFEERVDELADALGVWQAGAVTNADLGFATRQRAMEAPDRLRDQRVIDVGVGILAAREGVDIAQARDLLRASAMRAGIAPVQAATVVLALQERPGA